MNETISSSQSFNWDRTGEFNGIPCKVHFNTHIVLEKQGKSTSDYVESVEFQMLERAGLEVHSGTYS